jgi:hypothetical protein
MFHKIVPLGMHILNKLLMKPLTVCQDVDMDKRDEELRI